MSKPKQRKAPPRIDRVALKAGVVAMPSTFTWAELTFVVGWLGSETHLRHILLDEWKWVEPTDQTRKTEVLRKGKCVGGRPQTVYRKTEAGRAGVLLPATPVP